MKILVCFKVVPNWDGVLKSDWDSFSEQTDLSYAGVAWNCFDECALELGLRLKDALVEQEQQASLCAITIGEPHSSFFETLFAVGYDEVAQIKTKQIEFEPFEIAGKLADYAKQIGADIVFLGSVAGMADSGLVPCALAKDLSLPLVLDVEDITFREALFHIQVREKDGLWERSICAPFVVSVGNSPAVLRAVTLKKRLAAKNRKAEVFEWQRHTSGKNQERSFLHKKNVRQCQMIVPDGTEQFMQTLQRSLEIESIQEAEQQERVQALPKNTLACEVGTLPFYCADEAVDWLFEQWNEKQPELLLLEDSPIGKQVAAGLCLSAKCFCITGANVVEKEGRFYVQKRVCASNILMEQPLPSPAILTVAQIPKHLPLLALPKLREQKPHWLFEQTRILDSSDNTLLSSRFAVVCGAGIGSRETCEAARLLAKKMGGAFGLTRQAALMGFGRPDEIIGQSGVCITPDVCLVLGASGAGAFMAGMEGVGRIVAVDTNPDALIFQQADVGIQGDAAQLVEQLLNWEEEH